MLKLPSMRAFRVSRPNTLPYIVQGAGRPEKVDAELAAEVKILASLQEAVRARRKDQARCLEDQSRCLDAQADCLNASVRCQEASVRGLTLAQEAGRDLDLLEEQIAQRHATVLTGQSTSATGL